MAKWGESDPRWIVEERPDATNPNNWHWTEKKATEWSKGKLKDLLLAMKIANQFGAAEVTEVSKCEGEASANMRKAKLIFFYEWEVKCEWKGRLAGADNSYKGTLNITNLSEENSPEETEITVSASDEKSDEAYRLKELVRVEGVLKVREAVQKYVDALKIEYSQGMILPTKGGAPTPARDASVTSVTKQLDASVITSSKSNKVGVKISVVTIKDKASFKCRSSDLYRALTDKQMAVMWTRGSVGCLEPGAGGRFSFFDGNVHGEFIALVADKELRMRWRMRNWPDEHYSEALLQLRQGPEDTELQLTQTGVPSEQRDATADGWKRYYWNSLMQVFGWGAPIC